MKITLNIPHSSIQGFADGWSSYSELFKEVKRLTDWHTDVLFKPLGLADVKPIVFQHSRFKVDVERLRNDPLEEIGQGIVYTKMGGCIREIDELEKARLMLVYEAYQKSLKDEIVDDAMLIDCHSFASSTTKDVDVCIGFNDDSTKPPEEIQNMVVDEFSRYVSKSRIALNTPFSNSIAPDTDKKYYSMTIGINKSLYMNEQTLELKAGWYKINAVLNCIYHKILEVSSGAW